MLASYTAASNMDDDKLLAIAREHQALAHCPYSRFAVGAALLDAEGRVFGGCNVENASFGLTNCAERVALQTAVAQGSRDYVAMALVCDAPGPTAPCGACRQVLSEFAPDLRLICAGREGPARVWRLSQLLPEQFDLGAATGPQGGQEA